MIKCECVCARVFDCFMSANGIDDGDSCVCMCVCMGFGRQRLSFYEALVRTQ